MTVLPIVGRELRVAARGRSTYWMRLGLALGAILIAACIFILALDLPAQETGRHIFQGLAGLIFLYCLAYGRRATADCLSQEKRQGTLGLLFLTDLKGLDVVLGKLVATSLRGFYGLLAVFPVLAVPLLMGGITNGEFWRMVSVLLDTFLLSLAIGMVGSAVSRDFRTAMAANFLLLILLLGIPPAFAMTIGYFSPAHPVIHELFYSCPVYAFYLCADTQYKLAPNHFWWSVGLIQALAWLLIAVASAIAPHSWQDRPTRAGKPGLRGLWQAWNYGHLEQQKAFRRRALSVNAFYWLAGRARLKPLHVWVFLGFMAGWWLVGWLTSGHLWFDPAVAVLTAVLLSSTLKVWVAIEAGQQLAEDQKTGAFELMLCSSLGVRDILRGQLLALRRQFLWPILAVIAVELLFMWSLYWRSLEPVPLIWLAAILMLVADVGALIWVGMSSALIARSHNQATIRTVSRVLILPWALFGVVVGAGNVWSGLILDREWAPGWKFYLGLWFGLGLGADLLFGFVAWRSLHTRFRQLALRRFDPAPARSAPWFKGRTVPLRDSTAATGEVDRVTTSGLMRDGARSELPSGSTRSEKPEHPSATMPEPALAFRRSARRALLQLVRKPFVLFSLVLVLGAGGFFVLKSRSNFPPAIVVSMTRSNTPLRVVLGGNGVLMVLPNGSLWRWGQLGGPGSSRVSVPEQVGTNQDWVEVAASYTHAVGLRSDGTIWAWGWHNIFGGRSWTPDPVQVDPGTNWVDVAASGGHSVALRRDGTLWAWGDNSTNQLGIGPGPAQTNLVQVGTDRDWAAVVCSQWPSTMALRKDGSFWAWGLVPLFSTSPGMMTSTGVLVPTRVCRETNWGGFSKGIFYTSVWTRSGELWQPFYATPNPEASASVICRLLLSNAIPGRVAAAICEKPKLFQIRPNGTLWACNYTFPWIAGPIDQWRQVDRRADWVSLFGAGGAAFGLTADGTLWSWGHDLGREPGHDFRSSIRTLQARFRSLFGTRPLPISTPMVPRYVEEPRPLLRLVYTNATPVERAGPQR